MRGLRVPGLPQAVRGAAPVTMPAYGHAPGWRGVASCKLGKVVLYGVLLVVIVQISLTNVWISRINDELKQSNRDVLSRTKTFDGHEMPRAPAATTVVAPAATTVVAVVAEVRSMPPRPPVARALRARAAR